MNRFATVCATICCLLLPAFARGQQSSTSERPVWINGYFSEKPNSYIEVISATGYNEDNALEKAAQIIVDRRSLATGRRSTINIDNGNIRVSGSDELTVKARIIDQYTEWLAPGEYRTSLLVQTAKNPQFQYEPVTITNKYPFSARVFVPGMAQIHKGHTLKGALFITGEVAAVAGIVIFEGLRSSYESKIHRTHNAADIQRYVNKADNMCNVRNGFIAGAAAIYVWNVIDGIVAKGKKHIVVGDVGMAFTPYSDPMSSGLLVNVSF
ncbi:MAG: hypothetical protein K2L33_06795 [Muribaculaceae bacterium]|nr:hypothetical protein [Muribaculaceae bacterium]